MKNQKGFAAVEGLLILVIVGLISAIGWYVWDTKNKTNETLNNTSKSSNSEAVPIISGKTAVYDKSHTQGSEFASDFFRKYSNSSGYKKDYDDLVSKYGTDSLIAYYNGHQGGVDPIICAQMDPRSWMLSSQGSSQGVETILLNGKYDTGNLNVAVKVINQSGLKIDSISCPAPIPVTDSKAP